MSLAWVLYAVVVAGCAGITLAALLVPARRGRGDAAGGERR
jgi:hypothetical protein